MILAETDRLTIREATLDDAASLLGLMNEPSYHRFIGDRGLRTEADAERYIEERYLAPYLEHGYGLWAVILRETTEFAGVAGFVRRPDLDAPDIGYAFLPACWGRGIASEAARSVLRVGFEDLGFSRVLAITAPDNEKSAGLLKKIGLAHQCDKPYGPEAKSTSFFEISSDQFFGRTRTTTSTRTTSMPSGA